MRQLHHITPLFLGISALVTFQQSVCTSSGLEMLNYMLAGYGSGRLAKAVGKFVAGKPPCNETNTFAFTGNKIIAHDVKFCFIAALQSFLSRALPALTAAPNRDRAGGVVPLPPIAEHRQLVSAPSSWSLSSSVMEPPVRGEQGVEQAIVRLVPGSPAFLQAMYKAGVKMVMLQEEVENMKKLCEEWSRVSKLPANGNARAIDAIGSATVQVVAYAVVAYFVTRWSMQVSRSVREMALVNRGYAAFAQDPWKQVVEITTGLTLSYFIKPFVMDLMRTITDCFGVYDPRTQELLEISYADVGIKAPFAIDAFEQVLLGGTPALLAATVLTLGNWAYATYVSYVTTAIFVIQNAVTLYMFMHPIAEVAAGGAAGGASMTHPVGARRKR